MGGESGLVFISGLTRSKGTEVSEEVHGIEVGQVVSLLGKVGRTEIEGSTGGPT